MMIVVFSLDPIGALGGGGYVIVIVIVVIVVES